MSTITEINVVEQARWNEIVKSFDNYDVFYLNEYVTAFMNEDKRNGKPILLYFENGDERAINVVFKRDVSTDPKLSGMIESGSYFDLISPYGYGGFMGSICDYDELNSTYNSYCIENHYVCEFVRFELMTDYHAHYDGETETRTHNVVRSLELSMDDMWMDFKQKVRKNVNHATQCGLQVVIENTDDHLEDFLRIYYSTMDRSNAEEDYYFSKPFFETIGSMRDHIMYFHVLHEGKVISTELVIFGAENVYSYLGGTDREYFDMRPNDFLKYEIIRWAKEKGLKNFILGGGYGADDGIFQYKTCLAPRGIVEFYIGRKIFDRVSYDKLVALRAETYPECASSRFFPQYRA